MNPNEKENSLDQIMEQYTHVDRAMKQRNYIGALGSISYLPQKGENKIDDTIEKMIYAHMAISLAETYGLGVEKTDRQKALETFLEDEDDNRPVIATYGLKSPIAKEYAQKLVDSYAAKAGLGQGITPNGGYKG